MDKDLSINQRKTQHIDICLNENVTGVEQSNGFERYHFRHVALPEINFDDIDLHTTFLRRPMKAPFVISSMTGGTDSAMVINQHLAEAAESAGWAMGLGSTRAAIEKPESAYTFKIRKYAPTVPIFANLGAVQLNKGYGLEECKRIVDLVEADGLVLHLNSLQEVVQSGGDTEFKSLFRKIENLVRQLPVPIGIKEVGWGIDGPLAKQFESIGVAFIDVAGAGGTSWSQVEKLRSNNPVKREAAEVLKSWGISTADCLSSALEEGVTTTLIASGGMSNGLDAAKALALGASLTGFGRAILTGATESTEALLHIFARIEMELRMVMFGIGAVNLEALQHTSQLKKSECHRFS